MLRTDFYRILKTVISAEQFVEDDINSIVKIKLPLKLEDVRDLKLAILSMFGNFHVPLINPQENPLRAGYKFDSHFIDYDKKTIDVNRYGKLCARPEIIAEQLIDDPNKWGMFLEGLLAAIMNDPHARDYFVQLIKNDTSFVNDLKDQIVQDIIVDPVFKSNVESIINNLMATFDKTLLVGTWKWSTYETLVINSDYTWSLAGAGLTPISISGGVNVGVLDNKEFYLETNYSPTNPTPVIRCTGKFYTTKILLTVNQLAYEPISGQKYQTYLMEKV